MESASLAEGEAAHDLDEGCQQHAGYSDFPAQHPLSDGGGNAEHHQAQGVVHGDHGQQHLGHGAVGLVLPHHHQRGGGSSSQADGAQQQGQGHVDAKQDQAHVHAHSGHHSEGDGQRRFADLFQVAQLEFPADGIGDEAQGRFGNDAHGLRLLAGDDARHAGADDQARHQEGGHIGKFDKFRGAAHDQAGHHGNADKQQCVHFFFSSPSTIVSGMANMMPLSGTSKPPVT